jgi:dihydrofolate reductase
MIIFNMRAIVAINSLGYIGKDDKMLWHNSQDLKHFKNLTKGGTLLVGRKTFVNLPPLKDRNIFVVGSDYLTLEEALLMKPDWIIGGRSIYEQTLHLCEELHISHINDSSVGDIKFLDRFKFNGTIYNYYF